MTDSSAAKCLILVLSVSFLFETVVCWNCTIPAICKCEVDIRNRTQSGAALTASGAGNVPNSFKLLSTDICKQNSIINPDGKNPLNMFLNCSFADPSSNTTNVPENLITAGYFLITLNYPCQDPPPPTPAPPATKGYSTGSILLIIFFTILFCYLILGVAVNFFIMGARGIEMIPNLGFWRNLPGLVKDGAVFIQNGCRVPQTEIYQRSPESYDAI